MSVHVSKLVVRVEMERPRFELPVPLVAMHCSPQKQPKQHFSLHVTPHRLMPHSDRIHPLNISSQRLSWRCLAASQTDAAIQSIIGTCQVKAPTKNMSERPLKRFHRFVENFILYYSV